ncbi:endogenous retrovirus group k member 19 pol [Pitangus sulphuratus]|nr:endogenous retrovirus group k member 19 pol [Pitangus sulphuratus]
MVKTMVKQAVSLQPMEDHQSADTHLQPMEKPMLEQIICELKRQGVVNKTHSPFNSPIWPMCKSNGEWRLTVDYCGLNEVTPSLSAAVPDILELQYEL